MPEKHSTLEKAVARGCKFLRGSVPGWLQDCKVPSPTPKAVRVILENERVSKTGLAIHIVSKT